MDQNQTAPLSLIWVHTVCLYDEIKHLHAADNIFKYIFFIAGEGLKQMQQMTDFVVSFFNSRKIRLEISCILANYGPTIETGLYAGVWK